MKNIQLLTFRDELCRFYTKPRIAELLVSLIECKLPERILDLGAGKGALTTAAKARWPKATTISVDVDQNSKLHLSKLGLSNHYHFLANVMSETLADRIGQKVSRKFDVAICNPPYLKSKNTKKYKNLIRRAGFSGVHSEGVNIAVDLVFLAQNILLTKKGGCVALILASGLITSEKFRNFREQLLENHCVEKVVQLPRNAFSRTDAQAFLFIFNNNVGPTKKVKLYNYEENIGLSECITIDSESAKKRMDYRYYNGAKSIKTNYKSLNAIGAIVVRGTVNSRTKKTSREAVFHTSDFPVSGVERISLPGSKILKRHSGAVAGPGDILLARVGDQLHQKVVGISKGYALLTDCVFKIQVSKGLRLKVFKALTSSYGKKLLMSGTKGVGATILTKQDLINFPLISSVGRKNET